VLKCSLYWMCSIRLVNLMTLPDRERKEMTLTNFLSKFAWFVVPVKKRETPPRPPLDIALQVASDLGIALTKIVFVSWLRNVLVALLEANGGGKAVMGNYLRAIPFTALYCGLVASGTYENDIQRALTTLVTQDRYEMLAFNDCVILSSTLREFWGKRYNRLVSTLLRESVFQPLRNQAGWNATAASIASFTVSGVLHMHVAMVGFGGGALPALLFFLLHGAGCALETKLQLHKLPRPVGMLLTQAFFFATAPLYVGLFVTASPEWIRNQPLTLMGVPLKLPFELPVPSFGSQA